MTTALRLDYQRNTRPFPWAGTALAAVAAVALGALGAYYADLNGRVAEMETRAEAIERAENARTTARPLSSREAQALAQEVNHANEVLRQLSLPWEKLFQAVESSGGKEVALLAMEPDAEKGLVKISGEAKNLAAVLDYVRRLGAQAVFRRVDLQSHQIQNQDRDKPVRFVVSAAWVVTP